MSTLSGLITPSNVLTATNTQTLTNKTLEDPKISLGGTNGTAGQVPVSQGAGLPPVWGNVGGGSLTFIASVTANNSATVSFTGISNSYDRYLIYVTQAIPSTDNVTLYMRTSSNNGSSYDAGATDYAWGILDTSIGGTSESWNKSGNINTPAGGSSFIPLNYTGSPIGASTYESGLSATIELVKPSAALPFSIYWNGLYIGPSSRVDVWKMSGIGQRVSVADVDAIQFLMSSGNIASGTFSLYGIKK